MAGKDTAALLSALANLINDNTTGDITPEDVRDMFTDVFNSFLNNTETVQQEVAGPTNFGTIPTHVEGWRDLLGPLTASNRGALAEPDFIKFADDGAGSTGVSQWAFSPNQEEDLIINYHLDHDIKTGEAFYPHVHWAPEDGGSGVVRWGIEWTFARGHDQEAFGNTVFTYIEQAAPGIAHRHMIAEVPDPGITVPNAEADTIVIARIFRDATHPNDTYSQDAFAFALDAHYRVDRDSTPNKSPPFV